MEMKDTHTAERLKPILVTGANGLVGRVTLERLRHAWKTYALVREMPKEPLPDGVVPVVYDLRQLNDLELPEIPSTVIHLAQSSHHRDFPDHALDVFEVNVGSTQRLLEWGHRNGVKRFIYASSGGIYGSGYAALEEDQPLDVSTSLEHYIASKRCGELLAEAYCSYMTIIVLRFFFVYGPGQRHTMLIPRLLDCVSEGRSIILQGKDGIRINPIYVDDAAAAIENATKLEVSETINIAGPQELTLRELGMLMGDVVGHAPRFDILPEAQPENLVGSVSKMAWLLGSPQINMEDGLMRMTKACHHNFGGRDVG